MSNGNRKPDVRIYLKPATQGEGGPVTLAAFWTDSGKPQGGLDKRIKRMRIELEDGTVVDVSNAHPKRSHFCNLYMERGGSEQRPQQRRQPNRGGDNWSDPTSGREPSFGGGDEDVPF